LVIDDDPMVRTVIARILAVRGHRVLEAGSAGEGLAVCAALGDTLDLLIAEPALPGVSEKRLANRAVHLCPNAKMLYISAWPSEILGGRQGLLLPDTLLQKPFGAPKLVNAVETVLHSLEGKLTRTAGP
jgi:CheY-like chemotaxis protein